MSNIINIELPVATGATFFDGRALAYFVPEIRCVTKLKPSPSRSGRGGAFGFTVFLTCGVNFELGFGACEEGRAVRNKLLSALARYAGEDNVIFSCGHNSEVTVVHAIRDMTELFLKDGRAAFSILIRDVPFPLHIVDSDIKRATANYHHLKRAIETERRHHAMGFVKVAIG